jgi:hypothetical protein
MEARRLFVAALSVVVLLGCRGREKAVAASASSDLRPPAVAGSFYPADAAQLRSAVDGYLAQARRAGAATPDGEEPVAILVPHAGYEFCGPCAAFAFAAELLLLTL